MADPPPAVSTLYPQFRVHFQNEGFRKPEKGPTWVASSADVSTGDSVVHGAAKDLSAEWLDEEGQTWLYVQESTPNAKVEEWVLDENGQAYDAARSDDPKAPTPKPRPFIEKQTYGVWHSHVRIDALRAQAAAQLEKAKADKKAADAAVKAIEDEEAASQAKDGKAADKKAGDKKASKHAPKKGGKGRKGKQKDKKTEALETQHGATAHLAAAEAQVRRFGPDFGKDFERLAAAHVMTLKSCVQLAAHVATGPLNTPLHRLDGAYFYRGGLSTDVDGAPNSYAPSADKMNMGYLKTKYAPYYTDKGALNIVKVDKIGKDKKPVKGKDGKVIQVERAVPGNNTIVWVAGKDGPVDVTTFRLNLAQIPEHVPEGQVPTKFGGFADGLASAAYHPSPDSDGNLAHWDGIKFDHQGRPKIQTEGPYTGYFTPRGTKVAVNPLIVSGFSIAAKFHKADTHILGSIGVVCWAPPGKAPRMASAVVFDVGGQRSVGEGSPMLAYKLGSGKDPSRNLTKFSEYQTEHGIHTARLGYVAFEGSHLPIPYAELTNADIDKAARKRFKEWGGMARLRCCFPELFPMGKDPKAEKEQEAAEPALKGPNAKPSGGRP
ncbi:MAG: hypothetical protein U0414_25205 [Polyangiaceae bacterium]